MRTMAIALLLSTSYCGRTLPPPPPPPRQIIIFHDLSASLAPDQANAGQATVDEIIDKAQPETPLVVIPICENTGNAPAQRWVVEASHGVTAEDDRQARLKRDDFKKRVADQANAIRKTHATARSCISPALRRALSEMSPNSPGADVFLVSDMIEDCEASLLQQPIHMTAAKIGATTVKLQSSTSFPALPSTMRVFVVRPQATSTAIYHPTQPPSEALRVFWETLFKRCGLSEKQFRWDANASHYLT